MTEHKPKNLLEHSRAQAIKMLKLADGASTPETRRSFILLANEWTGITNSLENLFRQEARR
jgi:hypothetical protein